MVKDFYNVRVVSQNKLKYKCEVTVDADFCNDRLQNGFLDVMKKAVFPGFRPGKVSIDLVKKKYWNEVVSDAVQGIINKTSDLYIRENFGVDSVLSLKVDLITSPYNVGSESAVEMVYSLSFELMPNVPLISIGDISLKNREVELSDDDVLKFADAMLKDQRMKYFETEDNNYAINSGDVIVADYRGKLNDKVLKSCSGKSAKFEIGSGKFILEFENQLIGMKKGEDKTFTLHFPEDYRDSFLSGKDVEMFVKINSISVPKVISDNERLVKILGFNDFITFLDFAKKHLQERVSEMNFTLMKKDFFDFLDSSYDFDLPESLLNKEQESIKSQIVESEIQDSNFDLLKESSRRVKLGMLLMFFAKHNNVSANNDDFSNFITNNYLKKGVNPNNIMKLLKDNKEFIDYIKGKTLEDKVITKIISDVKKEKEIVPVEKLEEMYKSI